MGRFIEMELADRGDAPYWASLVQELDRPRVLELGAGTGRITRVLASVAAEVVAVDLSHAMLMRALRALGDADGVHLVVADMCELALARTFDLVVAANDPFVHLVTDRDRTRVLQAVTRHLRPGGQFVWDAHWIPPEVRRVAAGPAGWESRRLLGDPAEGYSVRERWELDPDTWHATGRYEYKKDERVVGRAVSRSRLWSPSEVATRFPDAGLEVRRMLGGFDRRPWDPDTATCMLVEAVRPPAPSGANA